MRLHTDRRKFVDALEIQNTARLSIVGGFKRPGSNDLSQSPATPRLSQDVIRCLG